LNNRKHWLNNNDVRGSSRNTSDGVEHSVIIASGRIREILSG